jgi:tetratricopeptide (TPR) repeat protein
MGDTEAAIPALTEELRANPNDLSLKLLVAGAQSEVHDGLSHITAAAAELKGRINEAERLQILGQVEFDLGHRSAGLEHLRQSLALEPENVYYMVTLATRCDLVDGCEDEARALSENAVAAEPDNISALLNLAGYLADSEPVKAITVSDRVISLRPDSRYMHDAYYSRARALCYQGKYEDAFDSFYRAAQEEFEGADAYLGMAHCLLAIGARTEAEEFIAEVQRIDPKNEYLAYLRDYIATTEWEEDTLPDTDQAK